jgi:hypothetical protein
MYISDVDVLTHILPIPFVVLPHVGGVASDGLAVVNLVVFIYSSAATDDAEA